MGRKECPGHLHGMLRSAYGLREWALKSYRNAVDPDSPDCLLWESEDQTLVDAAYIAESFLRGYDALWVPLDSLTKQRYIRAFSRLRRVDPPYSNWLLFSATVECFLKKAASAQDNYRISSSLRKIKEWYVGDGWYSDGPHFAFDYYNSYVIHPMYVECLEVLTGGGKYGGAAYSAADFNEAVGRMPFRRTGEGSNDSCHRKYVRRQPEL